MQPSFYEIVDKEVQLAIPGDWKKIPPDKLLGKEPYKIRHAFNSCNVGGKLKLINLLVLPLSVTLKKSIESQLIQLRDYILSKDCLLLVVNEETDSRYLGDTGQFIEDQLHVCSHNFLWLSCSNNQHYKTNVDGNGYEDLNTVIHDLWRGALWYEGPEAGIQQVNLELMRKKCWKCSKEIRSVTGIVFPNKQLTSWNNDRWQYFNRLITLRELGAENASVVQELVDQLRKKNSSITPVGTRYSHEAGEVYFSASCPHCKALQGDFYTQDERTEHLFSLTSRVTGHLEYYSFNLAVDQELLASLNSGGEGCEHVCEFGWKR